MVPSDSTLVPSLSEMNMSKEKNMDPEGLPKGSVRLTISEFPYWGHFRTFKIRGGYLCGICRKSFSNEMQARSCMMGCIAPYAKYKVDTLVRGMKTRYRCPFCYREYLDCNDATGCLARCKKVIFNETGSEPYKDAFESDLSQVKGRILSFVQGVAKRDVALGNRQDRPSLTEITARERAPHQSPGRISFGLTPASSLKVASASPSSGSTNNVIPAFKDPAASSVQVSAASAQSAASEAPAKEKYDPNKVYRQPGQKPFGRDNARYTCGACNSKFFTKVEAEACFETHPLRPDEV